MTSEDNEYGYDELRWLAKDTQTRRRRTLWWSAGILAGVMALATAYVRRDQSPVTPATPVTPGSTAPQASNVGLGDVPDSLRNINENLAGILQALRAQQPVSLSFSAGGAQGSSQAVAPSETSVYVNRVVWLVEGSRRFPMAKGDILWIPEANQWLQLDTIGTEPDKTGARTKVSVWRPNAPRASAATYTLPKSLHARLNTANCVRISSQGRTQRAAFGPDYVDIEVYFFDSDPNRACPDQPPEAQ